MPVFDFNSTPDEKKPAECTYTVIRSNENEATAEKPMMVLDNKICQWDHHSCGVFTNPIKRTSFEFQQEDGTVSADILKIDARFVSLLKWLGENHINVRLSGENTEDRIWRRYEIICRRRIPSVYDRASACKQCTGRRGGRRR